MATITDAKLQINVDANKKRATCIVTAMVNFTTHELNEIKDDGLIFKLDCQLWGDDPIWDDYLYTYPSKFFPDPTPNRNEAVKFEAVLPSNVLNEDVGKDEVYAKLKLLNTYTGRKANKNTNIVQYRF